MRRLSLSPVTQGMVVFRNGRTKFPHFCCGAASTFFAAYLIDVGERFDITGGRWTFSRTVNDSAQCCHCSATTFSLGLNNIICQVCTILIAFHFVRIGAERLVLLAKVAYHSEAASRPRLLGLVFSASILLSRFSPLISRFYSQIVSNSSAALYPRPSSSRGPRATKFLRLTFFILTKSAPAIARAKGSTPKEPFAEAEPISAGPSPRIDITPPRLLACDR